MSAIPVSSNRGGKTLFENAFWIKTINDTGDVCPVFRYEFDCKKKVKSAVLNISALGVYQAHINGERVGDFVMAPGWTAYQERIQYQAYDVTDMLCENNEIRVYAGKGWFRGRLVEDRYRGCYGSTTAIIGQLDITYEDGEATQIVTSSVWESAESEIRFSEIYDGEVYDASYEPTDWTTTYNFKYSKAQLIPQEGEIVCEQEVISPKEFIITPKGEKVIDFGQNLTGYICFEIEAKMGEILSYRHAEVLDKEGNFYAENLRSAKAEIKYICKDGKQAYKPYFTFMGFRYICIDEMPEGVTADSFKAIVVHSDMERTGYFECSNEKVNKLYQNAVWGQKSNYFDVPTDCPQRDERLGWLGDTQVFTKAASYNFNVLKFFKKWLKDLTAEQQPDGSVPNFVPNVLASHYADAAAWGDAAVICPWQCYLTYGDKTILENQIESMKLWVDHIRSKGDEEYLWLASQPFGDWLALDGEGINRRKGGTREEFVGSAYFAYSTGLLVKALKALDMDSTEYEELHKNIVVRFCEYFTEYKTQTECILALCFDLTDDRKKTAETLVKYIEKAGNLMQTGFVGTPLLLYALSENGYSELAYTLLLQEKYPSWLFSVNRGATTIWEHWNSIDENGEMGDPSMNSFNHYAYGAVISWMYDTIAGIKPDEDKPGFEHIILSPMADRRLGYAKASLKTKFGVIKSGWTLEDEKLIYECDIPRNATFIYGDKRIELEPGIHKIELLSNKEC